MPSARTTTWFALASSRKSVACLELSPPTYSRSFFRWSRSSGKVCRSVSQYARTINRASVSISCVGFDEAFTNLPQCPKYSAFDFDVCDEARFVRSTNYISETTESTVSVFRTEAAIVMIDKGKVRLGPTFQPQGSS